MKKTISTLTLLLGIIGAAQAQSDVSLGLKAGASYVSFEGDNADNASYMLGFHAGAFANIGFTNMLAFQPEIIYSQKGARFDILDTDRHLNYIDIPLMLHVNADGLFFEVGPQVGFLVAGTDKSGSISRDVKSSYNSVDFGYAVGLGYQRKTGPGVGLRYNGGFTNVDKAITIGPITSQAEARNSTFQLYLTYSFGGR